MKRAAGGRRTRFLAALTAVVTLVAAAGGAWADSFWEREKLLDDAAGTRPWFSERGIEAAVAWSTLVWSNVHGGRRTGTQLDGFLDMVLLADLEKLIRWRGLRFTIGWDWYVGGQPTRDLVGGAPALSLSYYEASNAFRFYEISLRQELDEDGEWWVKAGQLAADDDFMISRYAALFLNGGFGAFGTLASDTLIPIYPLAAPGGLLRGAPADNLRVRLGAYAANSGIDRNGNWGFGWRVGGGAPTAIIGEAEIHGRLGGNPGALTLGGWGIVGEVPGVEPDTTLRGSYDLYAMLDQAITTTASGEPRIGLFARASVSPQSDRNTTVCYADLGVEVFAPFDARPRDVAGIAIGTIVFGRDLRDLAPNLPVAETAIELTYQASITPWLTMQPDFQVLIDPPFNRSTAFVLGLQTVVAF